MLGNDAHQRVLDIVDERIFPQLRLMRRVQEFRAAAIGIVTFPVSWPGGVAMLPGSSSGAAGDGNGGSCRSARTI